MKLYSDNTFLWIVVVLVMLYSCDTRTILEERTQPVQTMETSDD